MYCEINDGKMTVFLFNTFIFATSLGPRFLIFLGGGGGAIILAATSGFNFSFRLSICWGWQRNDHLDGLVQDCSISSALAKEILQTCTKPSI